MACGAIALPVRLQQMRTVNLVYVLCYSEMHGDVLRLCILLLRGKDV